MTLKEGKYHQVKRMIAAVGGMATALNACGWVPGWTNTQPGEFRELIQEELKPTLN
ncbi:MAG: hypothetical protein ACLT14_03675 [Butyricicoccaceae bacterium]